MDAKSAIRWVRKHSDLLGIDPSKLIAGGASAGGHLAAAAAVVDGFDDPHDDLTQNAVPNALVLFNPVIDNSADGYGYERVQKYWNDFSSLHNIDTQHPPVLVFVGSNDPIVPVSTAEAYCERISDLSGDCELVIFEGRGHGFFNRVRSNLDYQETLYQSQQFLGVRGFLREMGVGSEVTENLRRRYRDP